MNIKKHHKDIIILNKIINNLITEVEKEDLSGLSNQELMDKAYAGLKKSLSAQKSQLGQFKEIDVDIEHGVSDTSITSQVWRKLGKDNRINIKFLDTIDNLEIPSSMGGGTTKIIRGEHVFTAKSFNKNTFLQLEKKGVAFVPNNIKDILMSFERTADINKANKGRISVYDKSNDQWGAKQEWTGNIIKYKA